MKKVVFALLCMTPLVMLSCIDAQSDEVAQGFVWTAPGDDGDLGTASVYDMRYTLNSGLDWELWLQLNGEPVPSIAGTVETCFVSVDVIIGTTYYFALRTADEESNWSEISNIVEITFHDVISPAPIIDFDSISQ